MTSKPFEIPGSGSNRSVIRSARSRGEGRIDASGSHWGIPSFSECAGVGETRELCRDRTQFAGN